MAHLFFFFFQAEDGIRYLTVTGVQTCALPIFVGSRLGPRSFVVARPCAPPPRSRAVTWLLLEFPSCTPHRRRAELRASVRDRGQMHRTAAGIGQERPARLDAPDRAPPEGRPGVGLLRPTFRPAP